MNRPTEALNVLKEASKLASPGQWEIENRYTIVAQDPDEDHTQVIGRINHPEDAQVIAAAHKHLPALMDYIEYLEDREKSLDHLLGTTLMLVDNENFEAKRRDPRYEMCEDCGHYSHDCQCPSDSWDDAE